MTNLPDGLWGYLVLLGMALVFHEPWRWLGVVLGRDLDIESPLFSWVRAVATALVAALVMRLTLFPAGALGKLPPGVRVGAFAVGLAVFFLAGRKLAPGVIAGAFALIAGALAVA
ncbi:MAG: AzlD domain-containing protein [Hyphomicrobiaceae bacterium]